MLCPTLTPTYASVAAGPALAQEAQEAVAPSRKAPRAAKENRIFLRASGEAATRQCYTIREAINKSVANTIKEVQRVPSSFALVPKGLKEA